MIIQSQVGFYSTYLKLEKILLKDWMAIQEWLFRGLSQNFIYRQIQTPKHLKSLWKSFLTSFGMNLMISRIRMDPMDIILDDSSLLVHSMVTLLSGIVFTHCLTLMSLVLLPVKLPQKG